MKIIKLNAKNKIKYPYRVFYKIDGVEKKTNITFDAEDNYLAEIIAKGQDDFYNYPNAFVMVDQEELNLRKERIKAREFKEQDRKDKLGNYWWNN